MRGMGRQNERPARSGIAKKLYRSAEVKWAASGRKDKVQYSGWILKAKPRTLM